MVISSLVALITAVRVNQSICESYQFFKGSSFDLKDGNSTEDIYKRYQRYGDVTVMSYGFRITPFINNTFGFIGTQNVVNSNEFEFQITFESNGDEQYGSLFTVLFYHENNGQDNVKNNTDMLINKIVSNNSNYNSHDKLKGFGIVIKTEPNNSKKTKTSISFNNNIRTLLPQEEIKEKDSGYSCDVEFGLEKQLIIRYKNGNISVFYNATDGLMGSCFNYQGDNVLSDSFNLIFGSINRMINGVLFIDSIIVSEVSMFNNEKNNKQFDTLTLSNNNTPYQNTDSNIKLNHSSFDTIIEHIYNKDNQLSFTSILLFESELENLNAEIKQEQLKLNTTQSLPILLLNVTEMMTLISKTINSIDISNISHHQNIKEDSTLSDMIQETEIINNTTCLILVMNSEKHNLTYSKVIQLELSELNKSMNQITKTNELLMNYYLNETTKIEKAFESHVNTYYYLYLFLIVLMSFEFLFILWLKYKIN